MNDCEELQSLSSEEVELLFFTIMGVKMCVDTEEIEEMLDPEDAMQQGISTNIIHESLQFRQKPVRYIRPYVLVIKSDTVRRGIVIDNPDKISLVKIDAIRPMPDIISLSCHSTAFWGIVLQDNEIIFLLDCDKISKRRVERD